MFNISVVAVPFSRLLISFCLSPKENKTVRCFVSFCAIAKQFKSHIRWSLSTQCSYSSVNNGIVYFHSWALCLSSLLSNINRKTRILTLFELLLIVFIFERTFIGKNSRDFTSFVFTSHNLAKGNWDFTVFFSSVIEFNWFYWHVIWTIFDGKQKRTQPERKIIESGGERNGSSLCLSLGWTLFYRQ